MKLRKATFRYIENELYDHHRTKLALDELTEDIILSTPPYKEIRTPEPKDPTGHTASLLATNKLRMRMIDTVYAIDIAFIELLPEVRDVLEDKYWVRPSISWTNAALAHNIDRSTIYRWRISIVSEVAKRLGMT